MAEPIAASTHPTRRRGLLPLSEAKLARLAAAGDERAFARIFERYHQELYRYCRAILRDDHEAQDALQATMHKALRSLPGERRTIALRPWLYRVAHNESISLIRARSATVDAAGASGEVAPGPEYDAEMRERVRQLVSDLGQLGERQRSALVMRELSDLSYEEIGEALAGSAQAARQAVYEARVALQEIAEARAMECESVRLAISERDGRKLRGRRLKAHLRACESCAGFEAAIADRREDLRALAPPLAPLAAGGILSALIGGEAAKTSGGALAGLLGAGGGSALLSGAGAKGVAAVAVAVAVGAGAADLTGTLGSRDRERDAKPPAARAKPAQRGTPAVATQGANAPAPAAAASVNRRDGTSGTRGGERTKSSNGASGNPVTPAQGAPSRSRGSNPPGSPPARSRDGGPPANPPGVRGRDGSAPPADRGERSHSAQGGQRSAQDRTGDTGSRAPQAGTPGPRNGERGQSTQAKTR